LSSYEKQEIEPLIHGLSLALRKLLQKGQEAFVFIKMRRLRYAETNT
jgi:hypothetical protein